jgi:putative membrane protein
MPAHHSAHPTWGFTPLSTLLLILTALLYLRGWLRLRGRDTNLSVWRAASFLCGLLLIWIAMASSLGTLDHELLTVHMIQHLLLMTFAPPLLWMAEPVLAFSSGLPRLFAEATEPLQQSPYLKRVGGALTQPAFCLAAASAVLIGWHIPPVFAFGIQSGTWHTIQQTSFFATGLLFWWPVVQPWPSVPRPELSLILYLFFATLPCDILSGFLVFCDRVVYPRYLSSSRVFGFSALGDQQCAAALMWTSVTIVYLVAGTILTMRLLSPQESYRDALPSGGIGSPNFIGRNAEVAENGF